MEENQNQNTNNFAEEENKDETLQQVENQEIIDEDEKIISVSNLFEDWFLDYASYVILERAVPHINDGLKPVQRRILHAMKELDDGRYNKVANIIGHTMQYHPHGDASIGEALVQLGQKDLLIDTQGNWGNIYTGDSAAAPRYIEARLSKFALDVVFNPKITKWKPSYDGRKKEPIHLPVKFPLLLVQGVEGIAVGLATKILPHNFNEVIDAAIKYLKNEDFELYPDFPTGGIIDVSKYNDGLRGGKIKVRARIEKTEKRTLTITEIPYGETTSSLIDSILAANEKGKIKIKKIEDKTASDVKIVIYLPSDISQDQAIDALYAFTKCQITISPNACVIDEDQPKFLSVKEILRRSVDNTLNLLKQELEIRLSELQEALFFSSLEKIFIEKRIYRKIEECTTFEEIIETIDKGLEPYKKHLLRPVTRDDIIRLTEIKIKRISKYDSFKADEHIKNLEEQIAEVKYNLEHIVEYTIKHFERLKEKYGKGRERKSEIRNLDDIEAKRVAVANKKLYVNYKEGFAGTDLKGEGVEFVTECSDLDDIIVFRKDGTYFITRVQPKIFIGQKVIYVNVFRKNDTRTVYNVAYRDGKTGYTFVKRFNITSLLRDKEYNLTQGHQYSSILYFSVTQNGESEKILVKLKPRPRLKKRTFEFDFSTISIKSRNAKGNILTKHPVYKIELLEKTQGEKIGIKVWFDPETQRLKDTEAEIFVGEFYDDEKILVVLNDGRYYFVSPTEFSHHFEGEVKLLQKFDPEKIYNVIYFNGEQGYFYLKRFKFEETTKIQSFIPEDGKSYLVEITDFENPFVKIIFGGKYKSKPPEILLADEHIKVKSVEAKGKRLTDLPTEKIEFIIPEEEQDTSGNTESDTNTGDEDDEIPMEVNLPNGSKLEL